MSNLSETHCCFQLVLWDSRHLTSHRYESRENLFVQYSTVWMLQKSYNNDQRQMNIQYKKVTQNNLKGKPSWVVSTHTVHVCTVLLNDFIIWSQQGEEEWKRGDQDGVVFGWRKEGGFRTNNAFSSRYCSFFMLPTSTSTLSSTQQSPFDKMSCDSLVCTDLDMTRLGFTWIHWITSPFLSPVFYCLAGASVLVVWNIILPGAVAGTCVLLTCMYCFLQLICCKFCINF